MAIDIDTTATRAIIERLAAPERARQAEAIRELTAHPELFAPPALFVLSAVLRARDEMDRAMFWFYAGQLRARFDANRCADATAAGAVAQLTGQFGPPINQHAFAHLDVLAVVVAEVIDWDRRTPHRYDHRWISLHGMLMMQAALDPSREVTDADLSLPSTEWGEIAERTRTDYLAGFQQAVEAARAQGSAGAQGPPEAQAAQGSAED